MATRPRTFGSLFAGIGGFDLGAEANGMRCAWQVEIDPFCRAALAHHWPDVDRSAIDVRAASSLSLARVDAIVGGFPCQDVSSAGKGEGLAGSRSGLWYEYRRIVEEFEPPWVFVENVASGAKRWVCEVRSDLHKLGYQTDAIGIHASDIGAPHRRARVFVVAYSERFELWQQTRRSEREDGRDPEFARVRSKVMAHGHGHGCEVERSESLLDGQRPTLGRDADRCDGASTGRSIKSGLGGNAYGISSRLAQHSFPAPREQPQKESEPPRTIERPKTRAESKALNRSAKLRAYGNAIVPQCAELAIRWGLERFGAV